MRRAHPRLPTRARAPVVAAVAMTAVMLFAASAPAASAAEACGPMATVQPLMDHVDAAHLERSPMQQVEDLIELDKYILFHTVLIESMIAPTVPTADAVLTPFEQHIEVAHLERSPMQQVKDLLKTDDYILAHTVLVEAMLSPMIDGCGAPAAPPMPTHGGAPPDSPPPAPAPAPAPAPSPAPAPPASTRTVDIHNYEFSPKSITVATGTSITWTNHDVDAHTVTQSGASARMKSKSLAKGATFSYTFTTPGAYNYICALHPQMKGAVDVQ